jgi:ribonuclease P/MRP protein subunit POP5
MKSVKLKVLPPTQRRKHRYIKFQIISDDNIVYSDLETAIWNTMLDFYGEFGVSSMNLWFIKNLYDNKRQIGILRCEHKTVPKVLAGLGLIERLGDVRITIKILKVSGTIKGLGKR